MGESFTVSTNYPTPHGQETPKPTSYSHSKVIKTSTSVVNGANIVGLNLGYTPESHNSKPRRIEPITQPRLVEDGYSFKSELPHLGTDYNQGRQDNKE